ncbi:hypothetical protein [Streptomyces sp. NBC_00347]|uniref:hypothetical protein n=1 Tax=Streptomyces sp. NBC_00347 TaxID=2975721 RepID=UPI00224F0AA3|nr:hypothetical protein [Streptomyces sp. NBC_00347]MCX5129931.1 hypothetical protein [Streptomyces sp. NBC_00347]
MDVAESAVAGAGDAVRDGTQTREVTELAHDLDPRSLTARVIVPDAPAGTYAVALTSDDPMDIVSPPLTIITG